MSQQPKQRSATERLTDLEQAVMSAFQGMDGLNRDIMLIKDAIKLLGNKVDSIVQLLNRGESVNDATIAAQMVQNNIAELKAKVDNLVAQGVLVAEEAVTKDSFIVARELAEDGTVLQPRIQTTLAATSPKAQEALIGVKPGETVAIPETTLKVEIVETYKIQAPEAPQEEAPAGQDEAPAAEASNS